MPHAYTIKLRNSEDTVIDHIMRDLFHGIGKPEPLKHAGNDLWSCRITGEHRLLYVLLNDRIEFIHCRLHYYFPRSVALLSHLSGI